MKQIERSLRRRISCHQNPRYLTGAKRDKDTLEMRKPALPLRNEHTEPRHSTETHRNTETQKPRITTATVASISVTLEPDDNWTVIPVKEQDDLPAHVKKFLIGTRCYLVHRTPEQTTKLQV